MKRFVRCICMVLALTTMLAITAFAAETVEPKASNFFGSSSVYLYDVSGKTFDACFTVTGIGTMDVIGANVIKIQRSSDGINWTTVATCSKDNYLYFVGYNTASHAASVRYTGTGGYYYRAYIELYAKKGVNSGYLNRYTSAIYIPVS